MHQEIQLKFLLSALEVVSIAQKTLLEDEVAVLRGSSFECGEFNWNNAELSTWVVCKEVGLNEMNVTKKIKFISIPSGTRRAKSSSKSKKKLPYLTKFYRLHYWNGMCSGIMDTGMWLAACGHMTMKHVILSFSSFICHWIMYSFDVEWWAGPEYRLWAEHRIVNW